MERNITTELIEWKNQKGIFLMDGIRCTGKTHTVLSFARKNYYDYIYIDIAYDKKARAVFNSSEDIMNAVLKYENIDEDTIPSDILYIMDEVEYIDDFEGKFERFADIVKELGLSVIIISSERFSSGLIRKADKHATLYPMSFDEFLKAMDYEWYVDLIKTHYNEKKKLPKMIHEDLLSMFEEYMTTGGMPEVVETYIGDKKSDRLLQKKDEIRNNWIRYIDERVCETEKYKALQIYSTIDEQLDKDNPNYRFNSLRKGATRKQFSKSLDILKQSGLLIMANCYENETNMTLFYPDSGIYSSGESVSEERDFERRIQNYICIHFENKGYKYQMFNKHLGFIVDINDQTTRVEYRKGAKLLTNYVQRIQKEAKDRNIIIVSDSNFEVYDDKIKNIPKYAFFLL